MIATFEQQVFSAMMTATHRGTMRPLEWEQAIKMLARPVAAAIRAAYEDGHSQGRADANAAMHDDEAVGPDHDSMAALAALRGETP